MCRTCECFSRVFERVLPDAHVLLNWALAFAPYDSSQFAICIPRHPLLPITNYSSVSEDIRLRRHLHTSPAHSRADSDTWAFSNRVLGTVSFLLVVALLTRRGAARCSQSDLSAREFDCCQCPPSRPSDRHLRRRERAFDTPLIERRGRCCWVDALCSDSRGALGVPLQTSNSNLYCSCASASATSEWVPCCLWQYEYRVFPCALEFFSFLFFISTLNMFLVHWWHWLLFFSKWRLCCL